MLVRDDRTISWYHRGMTNRAAYATATRVRIGLETMADKLKAAGYDFRPPPSCPQHPKAFLTWVDDQYVCPVDGDEFDFDTMQEGRDWQ